MLVGFEGFLSVQRWTIEGFGNFPVVTRQNLPVAEFQVQLVGSYLKMYAIQSVTESVSK